MSLGDSLVPDRTRAVALQQDVAGPAAGSTQAQSPTEALFARTDAALDAEFGRVFGSGGPEARTAVERAAATDGPSAYDRFRSDPCAFGSVVGDAARANTLGGALEALSYSKAVYAAEQAGRAPRVPGDDVPVQASNLAPEVGGDGGIAPPQVEAHPPPAGGQMRGEQAPEQTPEQVREALDTIRWCLAEGVQPDGGRQNVTHEDLRLADRTLYALTPEDATRVVHELGNEELGQWAEELDDRFVLPAYQGYDMGERDAFYARLAVRLDGEQLSRFATALGTSAAFPEQGDEGERFGGAIATYAPLEARAVFVERALPRILMRGRENADTELLTRATVEAVGGLRGHGPLLQAALADVAGQERRPGIDRERSPVRTSIERLLTAGVVTRESEHADLLNRQRVVTYDAGPTTRMVGALATVDDPSFRARVFRDASEVAGRLHRDDRATGQRLDTVPRGKAERDLRDGMTTLLAHLPNETIDNLMVQGDRAGVALTGQVQFLLHQGDDATITRLIRSVQHGDAQNQPAAARFTASETDAGGNTSYANATRLGYVAGATVAAFQGIADSDRGALETLADVVSEVVPVPGAGYAASEGSSEAAAGRVAGLQQQLDRLTVGLIPTVARVDASGRREWVEVNGPEVDAYARARKDVADNPDNLRR